MRDGLLEIVPRWTGYFLGAWLLEERTMSPEAQRIAIAEACGWKVIIFRGVFAPTERDWVGHHESLCPINRTGKWQGPLPDFLHDLNACHEMEKTLPLNDEGYMRALRMVTLRDAEHGTDLDWRLIRATAPQKAEAFLKALGKWVDEK